MIVIANEMFVSSKSCRNESRRGEPDPKTFHLYALKYSIFVQMQACKVLQASTGTVSGWYLPVFAKATWLATFFGVISMSPDPPCLVKGPKTWSFPIPRCSPVARRFPSAQALKIIQPRAGGFGVGKTRSRAGI